MEDMNELQMTCFEIISYVGTAKSMYINAVQKAKEGDFDAAEELIKQGDEAYNGGHDVHMGLLKKEANGERNGEAPLILLHAEDQMAGTETMRVMATELIEVHKQLRPYFWEWSCVACWAAICVFPDKTCQNKPVSFW